MRRETCISDISRSLAATTSITTVHSVIRAFRVVQNGLEAPICAYVTSNNITLRWGIKYIGQQATMSSLRPSRSTVNRSISILLRSPHWQHDVSVQFQWPNIGELTMGMRNLFNRKPPTISGFPTVFGQGYRIGNYFAGGDYDFYGRSLFMNVTQCSNDQNCLRRGAPSWAIAVSRVPERLSRAHRQQIGIP